MGSEWRTWTQDQAELKALVGVLLILVSLSLFIALGAWIDQSHGVPTEQIEHAESDNDQIKGNSPYQLKYVIGQSHRPAPLGTCIATLMRRPTCRRPMVLFMMALLLVLTCVCCCEAGDFFRVSTEATDQTEKVM